MLPILEEMLEAREYGVTRQTIYNVLAAQSATPPKMKI
jgi:hypothetical protein